ncbi:hypothetical protein Tcan_04877 [Toxocara canis]|uniref:Uncharacterized protein n=1 Tax=Toxocara canis TaxID=6265 RepID=A0A0B2VKH8_TOXCA|nr:hypothetical protein Tcan_04877 [Toxocara canis]
MAVLLVLCAYERQGTTAVVAESVCSITPDAKARKTPSDTSETSAPVDEKFAAEGATLEKNQTQSIDTSVAPMVQNDKVADTDSQARSHTADNFEDAVKQKEKLSKEITQDGMRVIQTLTKGKTTRNTTKTCKRKPLSAEGTTATTTQSATRSAKRKVTISVETNEENESTKKALSLGEGELLSNQGSERAKELAKTLDFVPSVESHRSKNTCGPNGTHASKSPKKP